jgi:ATPase subunit of ABC transporter with duplicated ATPase domains
MLAAIEDLLDSWPGTLLVVSHDRYFLERVTDQQYAILDAHLRHLPGGVDEYLRLRGLQEASVRSKAVATATASAGGSTATAAPGPGSAELRNAQKEIASIERRLAKLQAQIDGAKTALAEFDQSDYVGLGARTAEIGELEGEAGQLEARWFELTEAIS